MVSIRYFCAVGEFCRVKSTPRRSFTSRRGALSVANVAINTHKLESCTKRVHIPRVPEFKEKLKKHLQCELNQTWVCSWSSAGDEPKIRVVRGATDRVWRTKLGTVQQVKKFHPRFDPRPPFLTQRNLLEYRDVKIVCAIGTEGWINARFIPKSEVGRSGEARCMEPSVQARCASAGRHFFASGNHVWP